MPFIDYKGLLVLDPEPIEYGGLTLNSNFKTIADSLEGKAAASHVHPIANVTGLQVALDAKAALSHTHVLADIASSGTLAPAVVGDAAGNTLTITGGQNASFSSAAGDLILSGGQNTAGGPRGSVILKVSGTVTMFQVTRNSFGAYQMGFFGVAPVGRPSALTAANSSTVDSTYGAEESAVITNLRTRVNELETKLRALGLLQ